MRAEGEATGCPMEAGEALNGAVFAHTVDTPALYDTVTKTRVRSSRIDEAYGITLRRDGHLSRTAQCDPHIAFRHYLNST